MPHTLLIATVGGSPQPLAAALKHWRPARTVFVVSAETRPQVAAIRELARADPDPFDLGEGQYDTEVVPDAQDFEACVRRMRALHEPAARWRDRGDGFDVVLDFTGGTKCMSAALALVGGGWGCRFSYVGGTQRTKDFVGVVVDGREQVLQTPDPWSALGLAGQEDAVRLFDAGNFAAAGRVLDAAIRIVLDPVRKRELTAVKGLADGYDAWDRFEHRHAAEKLEAARRGENDLAAVVGRARSEAVLAAVRGNLALLDRLRAAGPSLEVVADLVANATRRGAEGRFDDAVARLYRATEALAQIRLRAHGFADSGAVPHAALPVPVQARWAPRPDATVALGVQGAYDVLAALGDPLAAAFRDRRLHDWDRSALTARNQSILAHGFSPIGEKAYRRLADDVCHLASAAGLAPDLFAVFPRLGA